MNNAHSHHPDQSQHSYHEQNAVEVKLTDPVCGMSRSTERIETYGFCSDGCLGRFKADPEKYLSPRDDEPAELCGSSRVPPL